MGVIGTTYPVPANKALLVQGVFVLQMSTIALMLAGDHILPALGVAPPALYLKAKESKMMTCVLAWTLGNMVSQQLVSTGAFEVYVGKTLVFSKLDSNRLPSLPELVQNIRAVLEGGAPEAATNVM